MKTFYFILIFIFISTNSFSQQKFITRGHSPGEIFISSLWYIDVQSGDTYRAVFYSNDNGKTISIRYFNEIYTADMTLGNLSSDKSGGVIYNWWWYPYWISSDGGYHWQEILTPGDWTNTYTAGCTEGEVYLRNDDLGVLRSTDYGDTFELMASDVMGGFIEVGTEAGEVYLRDTPSLYNDPYLRIYLSNNYGQDFNLQCELDTISGGFALNGHYPVISRGTAPGELYLVTWHKPNNYKIQYSNDYGQSFEPRFTSLTLSNHNWVYSFSAGYEPGTFYVTHSETQPNGNVKMYIQYSNDTAKTFTEFMHLLTPDFPVSVEENWSPQESDLQFYPNPFSGSTTISLNSKEKSKIRIYTMEGKLVRELEAGKDQQSVQWDGCNAAGIELPRGVYFIRVTGMDVSQSLKVIKQ